MPVFPIAEPISLLFFKFLSGNKNAGQLGLSQNDSPIATRFPSSTVPKMCVVRPVLQARRGKGVAKRPSLELSLKLRGCAARAENWL